MRSSLRGIHVALLACLGLGWALGAAAPLAGQEGLPRLTKNPVANVAFSRLLEAARAEPQNWLTYGGGYDNHRHSALQQVNTGNVGQLQPAWTKQFGKPNGFESTPIVVDGVMYVTTGGHTAVWALDARTGKEYWHHQHYVPDDVAACCDKVNRGVAVADGKVFFVTLDAQLLALDAMSGKPMWKVRFGDPREAHTATLAPLVVKDKVIVGISGAEYGIRGFIDAYDMKTGKQAWRFWTIPGPGEPGNETWGGTEAWRTGGGSAWITGAYDSELDMLYWTVGNPGPDYNGEVRPGDNLYTNSVVALDPDDGTRRWHFQWTPHDVWDYDGVNEVILADLPIGGRSTKALIHADKNGFFYALDRTNGKFLYAKEFARQTWAQKVDPATGRPTINPKAIPGSNYTPGCPGPAGAKEWNHMAFSPQTGLAYIPVIENCAFFRTGQAFFGRGLPFWGSFATADAFGPGESHGFLKAVNAATGEEAWKIKSDHPVMSGVLSTAGGLVFWGEAEGTFHATDAKTGKDLWTANVGSGIHAPPITYAIDGQQYVALAAGWGGWVDGFAPELRSAPRGHSLVVYRLGGGAPPATRTAEAGAR
ncbi:MAG: PQQ-dependent dehydrogenase, methanol/ethanol family [Gemmatimonadetes bacterium]|nr:PQQ-dependent dehydrogenase, methanol/ethanol family [Gemmatimonadota bacterium]